MEGSSRYDAALVDGHETDATSYDDRIVRQFATATLVWGVIAAIAGTLISALLVFPTLISGHEAFSFGRLRPVHTQTAIFAFVGNAVFAAIYYSTQRLCKTRMYSDLLSQLHFWGWQAVIVASVITIPLGITQGKEYAEPEWTIDLAIALVWIGCFGGNLVMTLAARRQRPLYISLWFYLASFTVVSVLHVANNIVFPIELGKSIPIYAGVQDAMVQWWYGQNLTMFLMTMPFLGLMYYFVPKASGRPVYSYKAAIIHFWSLVVISVWLGPHHLHYTVIPQWASSLGMVFGLMLWMPSWAGMLNGLLTLRSGWRETDRDPSLKFFFAGLLFYGWATVEGPLLGIKSVDSVAHYSDWTIAHVHVAALGWNSMMIFGVIYWLMPRIFQTSVWSRRAMTVHFWLALASVFLYVLPIYVAGFRQSQIWLTIDATGNLAHFDFIDSIIASQTMWEHRIHGGVTFLIGLGLLAVNYALTWHSRPKVYTAPLIQFTATANVTVPAEPTPQNGDLDSAPVLNLARKLSLWQRLDWHVAWERHAAKFVWIPLMAIGIAAGFEIVPVLLIRGEIAKSGSVAPYTPLELIGRDIYIAEGCFHCHSQMVRPIVAETKRYGEYSLRHEFIHDRPFQWGSRRIGPDLAREGGMRPSLWHWQHLENPRDPDAGDPHSVMPSFAHLQRSKINFQSAVPRVRAARTLGASGSFHVDQSADHARHQAEQVAADIVSMGGPIANGDVLTLESKAVALIAYLQRLGTDRNPTPQRPMVDQPDVDGPAVERLPTDPTTIDSSPAPEAP